MKAVSRFADLCNLWIAGVLGVMFAVATAAVLIQIAVRFVLPEIGIVIAAPWTEELARYLMVWVVFLGVAVLLRSGRLIAVELLVFMVPQGAAKVIRLGSVAICLLFFSIVASIGFDWARMSTMEVAPVTRIAMNWVYLAMPIGALIAIANLIVFGLEILTGPDKASDEHAEPLE